MHSSLGRLLRELWVSSVPSYMPSEINSPEWKVCSAAPRRLFLDTSAGWANVREKKLLQSVSLSHKPPLGIVVLYSDRMSAAHLQCQAVMNSHSRNLSHWPCYHTLGSESSGIFNQDHRWIEPYSNLESRNILTWKRHTKTIKAQLLGLHRTLQESQQVPESIVQIFPEVCQTWCCGHCLGEPVPVPNHPLGEKPFHNLPWWMLFPQVLPLVTIEKILMPASPLALLLAAVPAELHFQALPWHAFHHLSCAAMSQQTPPILPQIRMPQESNSLS